MYLFYLLNINWKKYKKPCGLSYAAMKNPRREEVDPMPEIIPSFNKLFYKCFLSLSDTPMWFIYSFEHGIN